MAKIKTKARTLDMLGRQQIAGIPTALSELFKNAHDAYADYVEVDYIRKKNLLILRDNGLGMTNTEFEERWLTIGTDSKFDDEDSVGLPAVDSDKKHRQVMGEKGIGRLAIAAIGPQVLILTRAKRGGKPGNLVVAFVNWTLFSLPSIDLSDIDVPTLEREDGRHLTIADVDSLLGKAKANVRSLKDKISEEKISKVCEEIDSFNFDPDYWSRTLSNLDERLGLADDRDELKLEGDGVGTHFIISPVDEILPDEIETVETRRTTDQSSRLEKALLGFTNTMQDSEKPPIIARFRDHTIDGECVDRISESIFFTPQEFKSADHHFQGSFDEFGQFSGEIKVFGQELENVVIPWLGGNNKENLCGPFEINLAYVQGSLKDTRLPPELWRELSNKTSRIGGLYIYRDGIRVLPYGDSDVDFLRIELRRTKSAKDYYFSYRNMLGYVNLTRSKNSKLQEKAGREGFIENKAYKQFKSILENFFVEVASAYFVEKGDLSDLFIEQRKRHQENYQAIKKRQELKSTKKKDLNKKLEVFFDKLDSNHWPSKISEIKYSVVEKLSSFERDNKGFDELVFNIQEETYENLNKIKKEMYVPIPSGIGFGKDITSRIDTYRIEKNKIEQELNDVREFVEKELIKFEQENGSKSGTRRRFKDSIETQHEYYSKQLSELYRKTEASIEGLSEWAKKELWNNKKESKEILDEVRQQFAATNLSEKGSDDLYNFKNLLDKKIEFESERILKRLDNLNYQLSSAREGSEEHALSSNNLTEALETEYEHIKEQYDNSLESIQLGMALGVVHHEFNNNIQTIRRGLRELAPWAKRNQKLVPVYDKIRYGFEHLDGYLRTFTPLSRRLARKNTVITGKAISEFLTDVFSEKLEREKVELGFTSSFLDKSVIGFTSTLFPAFVNLVDNSIYWTSKSSGTKKVTLDADGLGFIVKDTGPGIATIDRNNVFEFGFSKKISGQGMGLYIAKETLERDGFEISLDEFLPDKGAIFRIKPMKEENN